MPSIRSLLQFPWLSRKPSCGAVLTDEDRNAIYKLASMEHRAGRHGRDDIRQKALEHYRAARDRGAPIDNCYMRYMREIDMPVYDVNLIVRCRLAVVEYHNANQAS